MTHGSYLTLKCDEPEVENVTLGRSPSVTSSTTTVIIFHCRMNDRASSVLSHAQPHTHTHQFNGPFSGTTRVSWYQKDKTNLDFTEARDSEWQWHQLGICKSVPCNRQITTPAPHRSVFLQAGCPSYHPTNSVKALKASGQPPA